VVQTSLWSQVTFSWHLPRLTLAIFAVFDSRNVFDYHKMTELGFQMYAIGHPR
jgi:hypothetical protein